MRSRKIVFSLFAINFLLIAIHTVLSGLEHAGIDALEMMRLDHDGSVPEMFNYLMLAGVAALFLAVFRKTGMGMYCFFAICFAFAALDDSLSLHEQAGVPLGALFPAEGTAGINPETLGQLLYFGGVGLLLGIPLLIIWLRRDPEQRLECTAYTALLAALGFFAVLVDGIWGVFKLQSYFLYQILGIIEDGGEMLVVTVSFWCVLGTYHRVTQQRQAQFQTV